MIKVLKALRKKLTVNIPQNNKVYIRQRYMQHHTKGEYKSISSKVKNEIEMLALTSLIQYSSWSNKTRERHKWGKRNYPYLETT